MNCQKYLDLDPVSQSLYIGSLIHVCMSDDSLFESGNELIRLGTRKGLFDRTTILPHLNQNPDATNTD